MMEDRKTLWYTADAPFFRLSGFAFRKKGEEFRRFEAGVPLPPAVESLGLHTPGGQLSFMTDSPFIRIKFAPRRESHLSVNTRIGAAGFDLYMGKPGEPSEDIAGLAENIRAVGAENIILATDFGLNIWAPAAEGMRMMVSNLLTMGISEEEIRLMIKENPERLYFD